MKLTPFIGLWLCLLAVTLEASTFTGSMIGDGAGVTNAVSTNVFYSTKIGCYGDANLVSGGGHDDAAKLQAAIDKALISPVEVVIEKPSLLSTGLVARSNCKLRCLPGAGCYLANGANCPILWTTLSQPGLTNFTVEGGTWNCNGANQTWLLYGAAGLLNPPPSTNMFDCGMMFLGFDNVKVRDVMLVNSRVWGFFASNGGYIQFDHCSVTNAFVGQSGSHDSWHFWGPLDTVEMKECKSLACDDDVIAMRFDEGITEGLAWVTNGSFCRNFTIDGFSISGTNGINSSAGAGYGMAMMSVSTGYVSKVTINRMSTPMMGFSTAYVGYGSSDNVIFSQWKDTVLEFMNWHAKNLVVSGFEYSNLPIGTAPFTIGTLVTNVVISDCSVYSGNAAMVVTIQDSGTQNADSRWPQMTVNNVSAYNMSPLVEQDNVTPCAKVTVSGCSILKPSGSTALFSGSFTSISTTNTVGP